MSSEIFYRRASLAGDQPSGGNIPFSETGRPVAISTATGDIAEIERRRAESANAANILQHVQKPNDLWVGSGHAARKTKHK